MKLIIDIPEEKYKTIQEGMYCGMLDADLYRDIKNGTPLDDLRAEIEDYITHSPYIKSFIDCCRLRDDVMRIIDKYMEGANE